ncbi:MAG: regulatory protein RecX [Ruminococcaceae bacterium]|nr:regulatory protein RecX [Oscillospiraceae bacterium]
MDIKSIVFTGSGNEATIGTDTGYYDITRADLFAFANDFFGEESLPLIKSGHICDMLPIYADDSAVCTLEHMAEKLKAIKYSVYLLGINDKSEKTLRSKLKLKGYSKEAIDSAFEILKKNGYLSDERYAKRACELMANSKLFGKRRLIQELLAKGIPYDLCVSTVEEAEIDFDENLKRLYEKVSKGKDPTCWEEKKKLSDKLLRYGYGFDEINTLFDEIVSDF